MTQVLSGAKRTGPSQMYSRCAHDKQWVEVATAREHHAEIPSNEPMILFTLGDRRFAIQGIVTKIYAEPAEVIPIQKRRQGKNRQCVAHTCRTDRFS